MSKIYCHVRKKWVEDFLEEKVRQSLISHMCNHLQYPLSLISVEKKLSDLVKSGQSANLQLIPSRRIDIVVYAKSINPAEPISPLLLIECKADSIDYKAMSQVYGYNFFIGAPFIAVVSSATILFQNCYNKDSLPHNLSDLPKYTHLIEFVTRRELFNH